MSEVAPRGSAIRTELRQVSILGVAAAVTGLLTVWYMTASARRLGPAGSADFFAALFLVFLFSTLLAPIQAIVVRFGAQYAARGEPARIATLHRWLERRWWWFGGGLVAVALISVGWLAELQGFATSGPLVMASLAVFLTVPVGLSRGVLRSLERYGDFSLNTVAEAVLRIALMFGLGAVVASATWCLGPLVGALAAALVLARFQLAGSPRAAGVPDPAEVRAIARFAGAFLGLALLDAAALNLDVLLVATRFDDTASGLYGAAAGVTRLFGVVATPLTVMTLPLLTIRNERGAASGAGVIRICAYFALASGIPLAVMALWPELLIDLLYGRAFRAAAPLLLPHGAGMIIGYVGILIGQAFAAIGRFGFLLSYGALLAAEVVVLATMHGSTTDVAMVVLATKVAVLIVFALIWARARVRRVS